MRVARTLSIITLLALPSAITLAQDTEPKIDWGQKRAAERFQPLHWLVGEWQGFGKFTNRTAYIHKVFSYETGGVFLVERTLDMFLPPEPSTTFELHQDFIVYYRDTGTGNLKAKGFFVEGFLTSASVRVEDRGRTVTVESNHLENGPPGMRTRVTLRRENTDRLTAQFDIGMPGEDLKLVESLVMRRIR